MAWAMAQAAATNLSHKTPALGSAKHDSRNAEFYGILKNLQPYSIAFFWEMGLAAWFLDPWPDACFCRGVL